MEANTCSIGEKFLKLREQLLDFLPWSDARLTCFSGYLFFIIEDQDAFCVKSELPPLEEW